MTVRLLKPHMVSCLPGSILEVTPAQARLLGADAKPVPAEEPVPVDEPAPQKKRARKKE